MPHLLIIEPDGTMRREPAPAVYEGQKDLRLRLQVIVNGDIEHVRVLNDDGKPVYMVVNETGAIQNPPLPTNREATKLYWRTSMMQSMNISDENEYSKTFDLIYGDVDAAYIHGSAVVLEGVKVK